ncbi:Asp-tRNA(Asn)/Glu-tRNA(Gln) amidotransferase subunit GatB [Candidatus Kaiserbacteria bacterium]|nr:Asp-tRNA(Asn)/Glu-tRNA(Gln) amidotransferase subunit GatB [Candidatus Kaiserbacteria bacterium]
MNEYVPTIGLEVHAELKTKTKMFCASRNNADETRPNVNICPVCLAHPGTLPVINREAVRHVLRVGVALGSALADYTEFDRKNYFYPDLPKGYQLSQFEYPLVSGGELGGIAVTRVHLEEDTASSIHDETTGATTIDYNRAGVPLMELVTEPVIRSAEEAGSFARELQLLLRYLGASDANMEKGEMRVEANVSLGRGTARGVKVEIKNLNSFRAMERAVDYELVRQREVLERGESVVQETRGWDEGRQATFSQRVKEGSADYRYFPDPDLPSLKLSDVRGYEVGALRETLPELPWERRKRYMEMGIRAEDAEAYVRDLSMGAFFEEVTHGADQAFTLLASNYVANDLVNIIRDTENRDTEAHAEIPISAPNFKKIIGMLAERKISSRTAKNLLIISAKEGKDPAIIAVEMDLLQGPEDPAAIEKAVHEVIARNQEVVAEIRAGKESALEFLVGQSMKVLRGRGDPASIRELLKKTILP